MNDLLRVAEIPRSTFYYQEVKRNYHEIKEAILLLYKKNRKRDGYRPMTLKLRQMGFHLNHKTVLRLMNELGIHSILRKNKAFKKLQRELALARAEIAYLKELEALDRQKQRQKKEKSLKD